MPLPLVPLVGGLLSGIGTAAVSALGYFSAWSAKRIALVVAGVAAIAVAVGVFVSVVDSAISSVAVSMPDEIQTAFLFLPANIAACTTAIVTVHVARWVYSLHLKAIDIKVN
ncbi:MAG: hypothetical protein WD623_02240 [Marinobacter sp.]|uniref:hypothetical protein n=1 Tax=Marinobacter sp. TaxID=50741 RepID=UPI0034A07E06